MNSFLLYLSYFISLPMCLPIFFQTIFLRKCSAQYSTAFSPCFSKYFQKFRKKYLKILFFPLFFFLIRIMTLDGWGDIGREILKKESLLSAFFLCLFIFVMTYFLMNVLIGKILEILSSNRK